MDEPRNVTPAEDSLLRAAARRSAKIVAEGRMAAQPSEPSSYSDQQQRVGAPLTFFTAVAAHAYRAAATRDDVTHEDAMRVALGEVDKVRASTPAPAAVPLTDDEMMVAFCATHGLRQLVEAYVAGVAFAERHHGIAAAGDKP